MPLNYPSGDHRLKLYADKVVGRCNGKTQFESISASQIIASQAIRMTSPRHYR
jgi:hypothetical protein